MVHLGRVVVSMKRAYGATEILKIFFRLLRLTLAVLSVAEKLLLIAAGVLIFRDNVTRVG